MAVKAIIVNTPENITQSDAQDWATIFNSVFGNVSGILQYDNELKAEKVNNNAIKLLDGVYSMQGHIIKIDKGSSEKLVIESGTLGMNRKDAIIVEYSKNANPEHNDSFEFKVLKGTPKAQGSGVPDLAEIVIQDLHSGGTKRQEVLYEVLIKDDAIESIQKTANVISTLENTVNEHLEPLYEADGKFKLDIGNVEALSKSNENRLDSEELKTQNLPSDGSFRPDLKFRSFSGYIDGGNGSYPKPVPASEMAPYSIVLVDWAAFNANNELSNSGTAKLAYNDKTQGTVINNTQTTSTRDIKVALASDGKTLQFNQNAGYWMRIVYYIRISK